MNINSNFDAKPFADSHQLIWEHRESTDANRRIPKEILDDLIPQGAFRVTLEECYGGNTKGPLAWFDGFESLAGVEAAIGWVTWNNALACSFGRYVSREVRDEIYSDRNAIYANSSRPEGFATEVDGGYSVSGRWTLVSGCELADWFVLRCFVKPADQNVKGKPELRFMYMPKSDVQIEDTWHVGGLRGTGSHDVLVENIFVSNKKTFAFEDPSQIDEPIGQIPVCCINAAGCASLALGIATGALDSFIQLGHSKVSDGPAPNFRDHLHVQALPARLQSVIGGARLQLRHSVEALWSNAQQGIESSDEEIAAVWASAVVAAQAARTAVSDIYATAGTAALYNSSPIERAHRDIYAVLQHGTIQPHWLSVSGKVQLGLTADSPVFRL